jgi:hypothetical protein
VSLLPRGRPPALRQRPDFGFAVPLPRSRRHEKILHGVSERNDACISLNARLLEQRLCLGGKPDRFQMTEGIANESTAAASFSSMAQPSLESTNATASKMTDELPASWASAFNFPPPFSADVEMRGGRHG